MPKKKPDEELPPEEATPKEEPLPEAPSFVGEKTPPVEDKEATWGKVEALIAKAKDAYLAGSSFGDVIKSLAGTLAEMAGAQETELGGLGMPPVAPPAPEGEVAPPEEGTV